MDGEGKENYEDKIFGENQVDDKPTEHCDERLN